MDDLIRRQDAIEVADAVWMATGDKNVAKVWDQLRNLPSAQPLVLTCDGCRHVGTYDTDFPCSGCIRREKDYYEKER